MTGVVGDTTPGAGRLAGLRLAGAVIGEAVVSARSQLVGSAAVVVVVAAMCATVLLTTGRAVGAEQAVLASIDTASTRSLVVRADESGQVDTTILDRLAHVDGVAWAGAFSGATDVRNEAIPGGAQVPLRTLWTGDAAPLRIADPEPVVDAVHASPEALHAWGMTTGGAADASGGRYAVVGSLTTPDFLASLEPLAVIARDVPPEPEPVGVLVVVADRAGLVEPVRELVVSLLAVEDPNSVTITTSDDLAIVRDVVAGQLRDLSRSLLVGVLAATVVLVAAVQSGVVMFRRKDYGRRRALGSSQGLVAVLILVQSVVLAAAGAALGTVVAVSVLVAGDAPLPGADFFAAVAVLTVGVGALAALVPAVVAARRDPLTELRVP